MKKKILYGLGGTFIVFTLLAIIGSNVEPAPVQNVEKEVVPTTEVAQTEVVPPTPKTPDQILQENLTNIIKKVGSTNFSYKGIDTEKADPDRPQGSKMITVKVNTIDFYSKSSLTKDSGKLSAQIFQEVFTTNKDAYDVLVWLMGETTDRYGNKSDNTVMTYAIDKETYRKVNWSNFDSSKLCDFLKQEEKVSGIGSGPACNILANIQ
jgi:hypothetical protein